MLAWPIIISTAAQHVTCLCSCGCVVGVKVSTSGCLWLCLQSGALVLSALGLPDYIAMVQAGPGSVARGPDSLPLGGKMKDVHASIRGWAGGQASVMLFLAWGSVVRLLEQLLDQQLELGGCMVGCVCVCWTFINGVAQRGSVSSKPGQTDSTVCNVPAVQMLFELYRRRCRW